MPAAVQSVHNSWSPSLSARIAGRAGPICWLLQSVVGTGCVGPICWQLQSCIGNELERERRGVGGGGDRQADRQTDRQAGRQADWQAGRQTETGVLNRRTQAQIRSAQSLSV